ncbi:MAG: transposase family protein [Microthrixaceae bacterium]
MRHHSIQPALGFAATRVTGQEDFGTDQITVTVRLARKRLECPDCRFSTRASMTSAPNRRMASPRYLRPAGGHRVRAPATRCPNHGVRIEDVPFARPGTRVTRDVENLVVWCAKTMDWTAAAVLCRVSWRTVNRIIERVIPSSADLSRIEGLVRIGC